MKTFPKNRAEADEYIESILNQGVNLLAQCDEENDKDEPDADWMEDLLGQVAFNEGRVMQAREIFSFLFPA